MSGREGRSQEAEAYRGWYKLARWCGRTGRRQQHLRVEPLCRRCLARGLVNDGSRKADGSLEPNPRRRYLVVDHIEPHRGDPVKFWEGELQTLCPDDHDILKQREERGRPRQAIGADGFPSMAIATGPGGAVRISRKAPV